MAQKYTWLLKLVACSGLVFCVPGCDVVWQSYIATSAADCAPGCGRADGGVDAAGAPLPASCAELVQQGHTTDLDYTLYLGHDPNKPFTVFCHDMANAPTAYLKFANQDPMANFSSYTPNIKQTFVTQYSCVQIDPLTLKVNCDDPFCAKSAGDATECLGAKGMLVPVTSLPFATVFACALAATTGHIDLTGTSLVMAPGQLVSSGFGVYDHTATTPTIEPNNQIATLTAKSYAGCANISPTPTVATPFNKSGLTLQLAYKP